MSESTVSTSQKSAEKTPFQESMEKAAFSAAKYFTEMMRATNTTVSSLRLEEIEQYAENDKKMWRITISFIDDDSSSTMQMLYGNRTRTYKVVTVTDNDFVATSIKNRN